MTTRHESLLGTAGAGGLLALDPRLMLPFVLALQMAAFGP
jgi:hypothetical protein